MASIRGFGSLSALDYKDFDVEDISYGINIDGDHENDHETQEERSDGEHHDIHRSAILSRIVVSYVNTV